MSKGLKQLSEMLKGRFWSEIVGFCLRRTHSGHLWSTLL